MKAISAEPKSISELFVGKQYVIPEFQRPYTWGVTECEKLWDDIIAHFETHKFEADDDKKYFLGTIVVYPMAKNEAQLAGLDVQQRLGVIDGQQRLTTLTLLLAAFAHHAKTYGSLQSLLRAKNRKDEITPILRVETCVLEDDPESLKEIVLSPDPSKIMPEKIGKKESSRKNNFVLFRDKIADWFADTGHDGEQLDSLIDMVLQNVVVLPIHCDSVDDAFVIFEVVNNRGKPLAEADIFKSQILQNLGDNTCGNLNEKQGGFVERWKKWCEAGVEEFCFRALMRIKNAQGKDGLANIDTTDMAIRPYFLEKQKDYFKDSETLIRDLEKIYAITQWERPAKANVFWKVLECYPNEAWKWPLITYLFKNGEMNAAGQFELPQEKEAAFAQKCEEAVRGVFARGLMGRGSLNNLKGLSYKECARVYHPDDARLNESFNSFSLNEDDKKEIGSRLEGFENESCYHAGSRLGNGLVLLCCHLLHPDSVEQYSEFLSKGRVDIEHVCPKNWSNIDGWSKEQHDKLLNTIGNLIPLEKAINIQVSNSCFQKKKTGVSLRKGILPYSQSGCPEAVELAKMAQETWNPDDVLSRSKMKIEALCKFFTK